jgi:hypothetical protein
MEDIKGKGSGTVLDNGGVPQLLEEEQMTEARFIGLEESAVGSAEFEFAAVEAQVSGDSGDGTEVEFVLPVGSDDME